MNRTDVATFIRRIAVRSERFVAFAAERAGIARAMRREQFAEGLPEGLPGSILQEMADRLNLGAVSGTRHRHTSGWKSSGAFRIVFDAAKAGPCSVIYKNAIYSDEEVPALKGLGVTPGPGEYTVYRNASEESQPLIPHLYWAQEVRARRHYRYLMEDLRPGYRPLVWERDRIAVCESLPRLHWSLRGCGDSENGAVLPRFDRLFASNLLEYAFENIAAYHGERSQATVGELLENWNAVATTYRRSLEEALSSCDFTVVHGDCNVANVVFSRFDGQPRLYDFEWAGIGLPHQDLASILKGSSPRTETHGVAAYNRQSRQRSPLADWRLYLFCGLQRALLDTSFVARQSLDPQSRNVTWFRRFIVGAAHAALKNYRRLADI